MKHKFFVEAFIQLLVPILVPVIILGILSGGVMNGYVREEIELKHQAELDSCAQNLAAVTREMSQLNLVLSTNPVITMRLKSVMAHAPEGIRASEYAEFNSILDMLFATAQMNEYIDSIYLYYDLGGRYFLSSTNRITNLDHYRDTGWMDSYLAAPKDRLIWTQVRSAALPYDGEKEVLSLYNRVYAYGNGTAQGVLVLNIDLTRMKSLLNQLSGAESVGAMVIDENGNPLIWNNAYGRMRSDNADLALQAQESAFEEGEAFAFVSGGKRYVAQKKVLNFCQWRVMSVMPAKEMYAQPIYLSRLTAGLVLLVIGLSAVIAYSLARKNARDIQYVVDSIDAAKQGCFAPGGASRSKDIYRYILQNAVDSFIKNDYLELQLSQRDYHDKLLELRALQAQLNPHFLFNTLETIHWKAIGLGGGLNDVSFMVENLSDILHYALVTDEELVTVREEIEITNSYLEIQRVRYNGRFSFTLDCPRELLEKRMMKLIFQPLVENCIYHGVKQKSAPSRIEIHIRREEGRLELVVADDGVGMDEERLCEVRARLNRPSSEGSEHIGLYNTNKRIKLRYGDDYGVEIFSGLMQGTRVLVHLPDQDMEPR